MKLYKIYNYEKNGLVNQTMIGGGKYAPIEDINSDWFISEVEHKNCGLGVLTEYVPPTPTEIL